MRCVNFNAKVAYVNLVIIAVQGLAYLLYGFAFASAFNRYHPLVLNGGRLGTSVMVLNETADSKINLS